MLIRPHKGITPVVGENCFIAETAVLIGDVTLGDNVSIWYGTVLRGDNDCITVGDGSNIQDNTTVHNDRNLPVRIGKRVTIGHNAVIHGCTIEDDVLIGMGAVVMDGCRIGSNSIVAAGSLVLQRTEIPPNSLVMGSPAKVVREISERHHQKILVSAENYLRHIQEFLADTKEEK